MASWWPGRGGNGPADAHDAGFVAFRRPGQGGNGRADEHDAGLVAFCRLGQGGNGPADADDAGLVAFWWPGQVLMRLGWWPSSSGVKALVAQP